MKVFAFIGKTAILFLLTGLFIFPLSGKEGILVIPRGEKAPSIEGRFDRKEWEPSLALELKGRDGKKIPGESGTILLRQGGGTLYIAAILQGGDLETLRKNRSKESLKPVYNVDRIEMFLGGKVYFQFIMDWMGRSYRNTKLSLPAKLELRDGGYIVRLAVPFSAIPGSGNAPGVIKMNFYRQNGKNISSWKPHSGRFNDHEKFAPVFFAPPEELLQKAAGQKRKSIASLLKAGSLTGQDAAELEKLLQEKVEAIRAEKAEPGAFIKALESLSSFASLIAVRQEKNLSAKYGKWQKEPLLAEEAGKEIPSLWKPALLFGKDFRYAFTMLGSYTLSPMEKTGMMQLPLYREGMFYLRFFRDGEKMLHPGSDIYKALQKYPHHPLLTGTVGKQFSPGESKKAKPLFDPKFMERFISLYGKRFVGFGTPDSFYNGAENFAQNRKRWHLAPPRNREEAYRNMKALHDAVTDSPPEYPSFRNIALNSAYARKYANYHTSSPRFNHMMYSLGDKVSGNINGECCGNAPSKYAFARGAARQYGRVWENYQQYNGWHKYTRSRMECATSNGISPNIVQTLLTPDCRVQNRSYLYGLKLGTGLERQKASLLHPYLCGAGIWRGEQDLQEFFSFYDLATIRDTDPLVINLRDPEYHISPMAKLKIHFYDEIVKKHDRGVSVTPVALVFDRYHGYFPIYMGGQVWGEFPPSEMEKVMWAIDQHIFKRLPHNDTYGTSLYGDIFDVITNDSSLEFLRTYKVLYLTGDVTLDKAFAAKLKQYVKEGGTLVINGELLRKYGTIGPDFTGCTLTGETGESHSTYSLLSGKLIQEDRPYTYRILKAGSKARILAVTGDEKENPAVILHPVGKGKVLVTAPLHMKEEKSMGKMLSLFDHILEKLRKDTIPIRISSPMQYSIHRNSKGWIVYLQNNSGIPPNCWTTFEGRSCDRTQKETAKITFPASMGKVKKIIDLWSGKEIPFSRTKWFGRGDTVTEITLPGGDCCALGFVME